jgi:hypothetical protein
MLDRPWVGFPSSSELKVRAMFQVSVIIQVGNGKHTLFWIDRWMEGSSIESLAPLVVAVMSKRTRKNRLVADALRDDQWIRDISGSLSVQALAQYVLLWDRLQPLHLSDDIDDKFIWKWSSNQ